jgi:hypothetical protein
MKLVGVQFARGTLPPGAADAQQLGRCPRLVGGEHHPQAGQGRVEGAVGEAEVLGVPLGELDLEALGRRPGAGAGEQLGT